jgi:hypothetical protein
VNDGAAMSACKDLFFHLNLCTSYLQQSFLWMKTAFRIFIKNVPMELRTFMICILFSACALLTASHSLLFE